MFIIYFSIYCPLILPSYFPIILLSFGKELPPMPFYTPPKEQSFVMEEDPNYIVPVIASFNTMGGVQPLYFQYDDKTIKIVSVHWCEKKFNSFQFECTGELEG